MGLRIQNNVTAFNAHRNLSINDSQMAKSLERLSSGFRINRAADDAAGLSISSRFRSQISSLRVASRNTSEANSLVQTAEGGLNEITNMLVRLKELATQAASANASSDLGKLDAEASALKTEIDRIADSTKYGGSALINGNYGATAVPGADYSNEGIAGASSIDVSGVVDASATYTLTDAAGTTVSLSNGTITQVLTLSGTGAQTLNFSALGVKITLDNAYDGDTELNADTFTVTNTAQKFQVGTENNSNNQISLSIGDVNIAALSMTGLSLATTSAAQTALTTIDSALDTVNSKRGDLGAIQNRLGYAFANLNIAIENSVASESVIRDTDMASEMVTFTKTQILMQAGTAMLAQANQAPQSILSLLR